MRFNSGEYWMERIPPEGDDPRFEVGNGDKVVLAIQGGVAQRIFDVLHYTFLKTYGGVRSIPTEEDFNCHGTVDFVMGDAQELVWAEPSRKGEVMDVREALTKCIPPVGFQVRVRGGRSIPHSAVLLGTGVDHRVLVFHKDGSSLPQFCSYMDSRGLYPGYKEAAFYGRRREENLEPPRHSSMRNAERVLREILTASVKAFGRTP